MSTTVNQATMDELIIETIPMVSHIVRSTMARVPSHVSRDDLTSAGLVALVSASKSFEADRGVPFARYAATRIRGAILDELRSIDWASRSVRRKARTLDTTRNQLAVMLGRVPTTEEVAEASGLSIDEIHSHNADVARAQILSIHGTSDEDSELADVLPARSPSPEQVMEHREKLTYLVEAVAELPERLRIVVTDYFFAERPMADIAAELGVSESRVSQMRAEAMELLKDALNSQLAPELVTPHARPNGAAARRRDAYFAAVATRHAASMSRPAPVAVFNETA